LEKLPGDGQTLEVEVFIQTFFSAIIRIHGGRDEPDLLTPIRSEFYQIADQSGITKTLI